MSGLEYFEALSCLADSGVGLLIGTADADGTPRAGRAWGVRLDGEHVRVVITGDDQALVDNLAGRYVAVTGADVRTLQSAQLKGRVTSVVEPDDLDLSVADEQTAAFLTGIEETDGTGYDLTSRLLPRRLVTALLDVSDGFDQTPGPTAGAPLSRQP